MTDFFRNEHLEPVFTEILPALEKSGIKYWVCGGIANAGFYGSFFRVNKDVDIFVAETDFNSVKTLLEKIASDYQWELKLDYKIVDRPKLEIYIDFKERLSVTPFYKIGSEIEFRLRKNVWRYPIEILNRTEREIGSYKFYTPSDEYIKAIFINYLEAKPKSRNRRAKDAEKILTKEEFGKYFPRTLGSILKRIKESKIKAIKGVIKAIKGVRHD